MIDMRPLAIGALGFVLATTAARRQAAFRP
jgi:hypothetical protein